MKTTLTASQKKNLSDAIRNVIVSNDITKLYILTRRKYICKNLLLCLSNDYPIIYTYNALSEKTRVQMLRIIAYIVGYHSGSVFDKEAASRTYGSETVSCFYYMLNYNPYTYLK